jgi:DNA helicase HerA-like ATPase
MTEQAKESSYDSTFPPSGNTDKLIADLEAEFVETDAEFTRQAKLAEGAIAFVHFDPTTAQSNVMDALVHYEDLDNIDRGLYVLIHSIADDRYYSGRIVEGPFYDPDALKRDSTPVQFIILNQGTGKVLSLPEYHGRISIEILGEERDGTRFGAVRRPRPGSPVKPYDSTMMKDMLNLSGNICLGYLDNYENTFVLIDEKDKGVIPRNWMTVGTIGSGKSNTNQVFIEETLTAGFAQVVIDPEGEYIFMDQPSDAKNILKQLRHFDRQPQGVKELTVYRPPLSVSKRKDAIEFSVPFDALSPEMIVELTDMSPAQITRFPLLYEQAIQCLLKETESKRTIQQDEMDISRGFGGMTLQRLITMLEEELEYYTQGRENKKKGGTKANSQRDRTAKGIDNDEEKSAVDNDIEKQCYFHRHQLEPLIRSQQDLVSYWALYNKLRQLQRTHLFDRKDALPLNAQQLCQPGRLAVIDMSDCGERQVVNIIIADLLARIYRYKINLKEEQNVLRKVIITIEEAHGFVSRERQNKMEQTLDQLRRIARRGRKRWLCLHLVTQSPQHLPSELFELANNKIIHQMTGPENLRVLKAAAGTVNEGIWEDVPSLGRGRAVIVSSQYPHPLIARIRPAASKRNYQN